MASFTQNRHAIARAIRSGNVAASQQRQSNVCNKNISPIPTAIAVNCINDWARFTCLFSSGIKSDPAIYGHWRLTLNTIASFHPCQVHQRGTLGTLPLFGRRRHNRHVVITQRRRGRTLKTRDGLVVIGLRAQLGGARVDQLSLKLKDKKGG